jgi:hypothetical protein
MRQEETSMEQLIDKIRKQGDQDVSLAIPEPLHERLAAHEQTSGEPPEETVIKALDAYFKSRAVDVVRELRDQ